jgi:REP element-mobilizing transposase RayT
MPFVDLNFHLVWSTRNRSRFLKQNCWSDFSSLIGGMVNKRRCMLMAIGGVQDHVHLLASRTLTQLKSTSPTRKNITASERFTRNLKCY